MAEVCPGCGSKRFYFVQEVTEYHLFDVRDDGGVDLEELAETVPGNSSYKLWCEFCGKTFTVSEILEMRQKGYAPIGGGGGHGRSDLPHGQGGGGN